MHILMEGVQRCNVWWYLLMTCLFLRLSIFCPYLLSMSSSSTTKLYPLKPYCQKVGRTTSNHRPMNKRLFLRNRNKEYDFQFYWNYKKWQFLEHLLRISGHLHPLCTEQPALQPLKEQGRVQRSALRVILHGKSVSYKQSLAHWGQQI